jgi:hypothetical protein
MPLTSEPILSNRPGVPSVLRVPALVAEQEALDVGGELLAGLARLGGGLLHRLGQALAQASAEVGAEVGRPARLEGLDLIADLGEVLAVLGEQVLQVPAAVHQLVAAGSDGLLALVLGQPLLGLGDVALAFDDVGGVLLPGQLSLGLTHEGGEHALGLEVFELAPRLLDLGDELLPLAGSVAPPLLAVERLDLAVDCLDLLLEG